jgi:hypothetical protein
LNPAAVICVTMRMRATRDSAGNGSTGACPAGIEAGANRTLAEMEAIHEQKGGKKLVIEQYTANAGAPPEWRHTSATRFALSPVGALRESSSDDRSLVSWH